MLHKLWEGSIVAAISALDTHTCEVGFKPGPTRRRTRGPDSSQAHCFKKLKRTKRYIPSNASSVEHTTLVPAVLLSGPRLCFQIRQDPCPAPEDVALPLLISSEHAPAHPRTHSRLICLEHAHRTSCLSPNNPTYSSHPIGCHARSRCLKPPSPPCDGGIMWAFRGPHPLAEICPPPPSPPAADAAPCSPVPSDNLRYK